MDLADKLNGWIANLTSFDMWEKACNFYKENEEELVEMNKEQLRDCKLSNGRDLLGLSQEPRPFYNTGAFYAGITIVIEPDKIMFISTDPKWSQHVPPARRWYDTMAPFISEIGLSMLGIPEDREEGVNERRNTAIADAFRQCFE